ncbi:hypothetical protein CEUSTIGMA_g13257.t1 [Chlamydomonas eustigma]|uniref:YbaK/aminoacyl-tRNA synthetase-associated domain-containing protein n=1 Tax=Chlamydomonas eustigma TaxID=1157962 RepID=A0A250XSD9_9CHLO|nr:hypothetical protein CEUSTIGMA_g13257.t1 [Chlamydomonas eustigma]|eukprot:GAX85842.1 hypothetical protein CEUSTIGMA_g13257.t1 [Chlamydomonas eustigma]
MLSCLQVPQGSVTPFAAANCEGIALLLDQQINSQSAICMHPMVNTSTLIMSPDAFQAALRSVRLNPLFVDLEADPKIDRDNPPDLAKYVPELVLVPTLGAAGAASSSDASATSAPPGTTSSAAPALQDSTTKQQASKKAVTKASNKAPDTSTAASGGNLSLSDRVEDILQKVSLSLCGCKLEDSPAADAYNLGRLRADVEMQLNALKNLAYTSGYVAGKGELVSAAEKRFA